MPAGPPQPDRRSWTAAAGPPMSYTDLEAGIALHLDASHAHFAPLHMNQDGVIR